MRDGHRQSGPCAGGVAHGFAGMLGCCLVVGGCHGACAHCAVGAWLGMMAVAMKWMLWQCGHLGGGAATVVCASSVRSALALRAICAPCLGRLARSCASALALMLWAKIP